MRPPLFSERHKNQKACERGRESKMSNEIKRIDRKLAYEGAVINVYQDTVQFPDGHTAKWDYIHHDGAAAVIPVLPDGRILMVKQYRNALDRFTLEIPAGKLDDPKEEGIVCASRELEEETGYRCERLEPLLVLRTTVAFCNERIEVFAARDLPPASGRGRIYRSAGLHAGRVKREDLQRGDTGLQDSGGNPGLCGKVRQGVRLGVYFFPGGI